MDSFDRKKNEYLSKISEFMLSNGISSCSLKKMAEAASTSDRMLMHYFKDKDEILTLTLNHISQDMIELLNSAPKVELCFEEFAALLSNSIKSDQFRPYLNLWFELIHLASGEKDPYRSISKEIGESYWNWLTSTYKAAQDEDAKEMSALLFAFIEGLVLLDKMGMGDKIGLAEDAMMNLYRTKKR